MNTLVLNGTPQDLRLILDISKKIGIDLKIVKQEKKETHRKKGLSAALALAKTRKSYKISQQEIVNECRSVRKKIYEK